MGTTFLARRSGDRLKQFLRDDKLFPRLARLQFFIWTAIVIFEFAWVTLIRIFSGIPPFISPGEITPNLLAVMGIGTGSTVASAGIESLRPSKNGKEGSDRGTTAPPAAPGGAAAGPTPAPGAPVASTAGAADFRPDYGGYLVWGSMLCEWTSDGKM